ncbi:MAG: hypothetical protein A2174_02720 [Candidatus Portnoybacteria bacterium RBG_13_41_18]|uniref:L,D-TPase catalytic domain-containing protein n=1 Tax=Candidatus Portnoybacteria bacterium RBG_13_41_18 TaxID=1801991 RepID=A0A1G2FAB6_9BACT|nr:MAG: hypothetical protein A2174_02720 [Candidatus Portnoybacteria bacterium RBG_13_41_18]
MLEKNLKMEENQVNNKKVNYLKYFKITIFLLVILLFFIIAGYVILNIWRAENNYSILPSFIAKEIAPADLPQSSDAQKRIEIDLRRQRMILYLNDEKIAEYVISSGRKGKMTMAGNFSILTKYPVAFGGLSQGQRWTMPYFIGFYMVGTEENGIHEMPFIDGWREPATDLGYPVSHGCVRLGVGIAEKVYNFAEIGTPVWAHY